MAEMLIAGILFATALVAVSRISIASLISSSHLADRSRIEADINDNIQAMQKGDFYYTHAFILNKGGEEALQRACDNPPKELSNHLQGTVPQPRLTTITRSFDVNSAPGILRVIYSFEGPERQIQEEKRIIEMTPNFAAMCYKTR